MCHVNQRGEHMVGNYNLLELVTRGDRENNRETLEFFLQYGRKQVFSKNDLIILEGDVSDGIYLILDGLVEIVKKDNRGNEVIIAEMGQGSVVGEMGVFLNNRRTASVRAKTRVVSYRFTNMSFITPLAKMPDLLLRLLQSFARKIDVLNKRLVEAMDASAILTVGTYILAGWTGKRKKEAVIKLDVREITKETGLSEKRIFTAIDTCAELKSIRNINIDSSERKVKFTINYTIFMNLLKDIGC